MFVRIECKIEDPQKLPKNFAMLNVLNKHLESQIVTISSL